MLRLLGATIGLMHETIRIMNMCHSESITSKSQLRRALYNNLKPCHIWTDAFKHSNGFVDMLSGHDNVHLSQYNNILTDVVCTLWLFCFYKRLTITLLVIAMVKTSQLTIVLCVV